MKTKEKITQSDASRLFGRSRQQVNNDLRSNKLDQDNKGLVIVNEKFMKRRNYYMVLDENK
jgi:hypothetical protein